MALTAEEIVSNRRQWAAELRSGNWPQGRGEYECAGAYCCLGVMSKLFFGTPTPPTYKSEKEPCGLNGDDIQRLIIANDEGATFAQIADMVDALPAPEVKP